MVTLGEGPFPQCFFERACGWWFAPMPTTKLVSPIAASPPVSDARTVSGHSVALRSYTLGAGYLCLAEGSGEGPRGRSGRGPQQLLRGGEAWGKMVYTGAFTTAATTTNKEPYGKVPKRSRVGLATQQSRQRLIASAW